MKDQTLLEVRNLSKAFYSRHGVNVAVDDVSFKVARGEILGLIGQSGSGKTTVANALVRLLKDVGGVVTLDGRVVSGRLWGRRRKQYNRSVQKIFQDPHTALNDKRNVFSTIVEPLKAHRIGYKLAWEYIINDKLILQTFRFSLRDEFLRAEAELATLRADLRAAARAESLHSLSHFQAGNLATEDERENALSELIASYYDPLLNAEERILARETQLYNELIAFYTSAYQKIKARDLPWDEVDLVNAKQALTSYVNSFDDKKISRVLTKLARDYARTGRNGRHETRELLRALKKERQQKIKFNQSLAALAKTNEERARLMATKAQLKAELDGFSTLLKQNLAVPGSLIFDLAADLAAMSDLATLKTYFSTKGAALAKISQAEATARQEAYVLARDQALLGQGEANKADPNVVAELTAKVDAAQSVFDAEAAQAQVKYDALAAQWLATTTAAQTKYDAAQIKAALRELKQLFDQHFKVLMVAITDRNDKATKRRQLKNKQAKFAAHLLEQKQVHRKLAQVRQLYGLKRVPLIYKGFITRKLLLDRAVMNALSQVGLKPEHAYRYPHEFSGGQKQRINIARALILEPELIIADEPIASLDVSIQAQIINLLIELVKKRNISMIFIGHDLSIIKYLADSLCVMHLGKIVERGVASRIFNHPVHPYTKTLLAVIPKISNANEPFHAPAETRDYLREYAVSAPRAQLVEPQHLVLANDAQVLKWWGAPLGKVSAADAEYVSPRGASDEVITREVASAAQPISLAREEESMVAASLLAAVPLTNAVLTPSKKARAQAKVAIQPKVLAKKTTPKPKVKVASATKSDEPTPKAAPRRKAAKLSKDGATNKARANSRGAK